MRRIAYSLFVLAGVSIVIAAISFVFAANQPPDLRTRALGYGIINIGFAAVNGMLGLVLLLISRGP